jgi:hypothetical protein
LFATPKDTGQRTAQRRPIVPGQLAPSRRKKTTATQAFTHIKKLVADMEQDQFEKLAEQMNELELPINNQDPF